MYSSSQTSPNARPMTRLTTPCLAALLCPALFAQATLLEQSGSTAVGVGPVDADFIGDYAISLPLANTGTATLGRVQVTSGVAGTALFDLTPTGDPSFFGHGISRGGDVNHDGTTDILVFDPRGNVGRVWLFNGADGALLQEWSGGPAFGTTACAAGDVDQDGFGDIAVGSPDAAGAAVFTYSGQTGALLRTRQGQIGQFGGVSLDGIALEPAGDFDGDGFEDLLVGAPFTGVSMDHRSEVISGATGDVLLEMSVSGFEGLHGTFVGRLGDVTGDGVEDYWTGGAQPINTPFGLAAIRAISGASGQPIHTFDAPIEAGGTNPLEYANQAVPLDDVDGDGRPDLVVVWSNTQSPLSAPMGVQAVVYSGASGAPVFTAVGSEIGAFGNLGDINGDGFGDLAHGFGNSTFQIDGRAFDELRLIERTPDNGRSICLGLPNSTGQGSVLRALSSSGYVASANDLTLAVTRLPANTFGVMVVGVGSDIVFFPGGSEGRFCVTGGPIGRLGLVQSDATGSAAYSPDLTQISLATASGQVTVPVQPGDTYHFQLWHRDAGAMGPSSNFSAAVGILFE